MTISRRAALKGLGASGVASILNARPARADAGLTIAGHPVELSIAPLGDHIVRISVVSLEGGQAQPIPLTGSLVEHKEATPVLHLADIVEPRSVSCGAAR